MKEKINSISAIWMSDEKAILEECTKSILGFLLLLKNHNNELFKDWYEKDKSKNAALKNKILLEQSYFERALDKKWNKDDLGTRLSYWTGNEDDNKSAEISFNVGAYGRESFNKNICVITLPKNNEYNNNLENREVLIKLITDYWKPDKILINGEVTKGFIS